MAYKGSELEKLVNAQMQFAFIDSWQTFCEWRKAHGADFDLMRTADAARIIEHKVLEHRLDCVLDNGKKSQPTWADLTKSYEVEQKVCSTK